MRREDYQPKQARNEALLTLFDVSCVKCGSVNLKFISEFDDDSDETAIYLFCPRCRQRACGCFGKRQETTFHSKAGLQRARPAQISPSLPAGRRNGSPREKRIVTVSNLICGTETAIGGGSGELILPSKPFGVFVSISFRARKCANTSPHNQTYYTGVLRPHNE